MGRMMGKHADLLSPDAMRDYFGEVYWRKGEELDRENVLQAFRLSLSELSFDYRTVSEAFRMIESGLAPVIVAREAPARDALVALRVGAPAGAGSTSDEIGNCTPQLLLITRQSKFNSLSFIEPMTDASASGALRSAGLE
jgi:hypothetical protein